MADDAVEAFVWRHLQRRLSETEGAPADAKRELRRLVSVERTGTGGAGEQALVRFQLSFRRGEISVELNAHDAEPLSWILPKLAEGQGPAPAAAEALRLAAAAAGPPPGAVLVNAAYEDVGGRPIFVAHWEHVEQGIKVERDYARALVSGDSGKVFSVQRRWHDVDVTPGER